MARNTGTSRVPDNLQELTVHRLGGMGDGICDHEDGPIYVAGGVPGDIVRASVADHRACIHTIIHAGPARVQPRCQHFDTCGGCRMQHVSAETYRDWKHAQVVAAFARQNIDADVKPMLGVQPGTRRRAVLSARRSRASVRLGFHQDGTHTLVPIAECLVLVPEIVSALPGLQALVRPLLGRRNEVRLTVTATPTGMDVAVTGSSKELDVNLRAELAGLAGDVGLARLTISDELIVEFATPSIQCGRAMVTLPAGAFLQATASAQEMLTTLVLEGVAAAGTIAELFAGIGTFTFGLAERATVSAIDGDAAAIAALRQAARQTSGLKPITTSVRDLSREPMTSQELSTFDAVVFDPPRAGARAQAGEIARSSVRRVVAVSCNPATLVRDAHVLMAGGFRLLQVTPVDQFLYSTHVEAVAVFAR